MADEPEDQPSPPTGPYGAPPPGPYGAPPPGPYGAPPPGPYGAPTPGPYGAPPPGYGPPGYGWGPPPGYGPGWAYPQPPRNSERAGWVLGLGVAPLVMFFTCLLGFVPAIVSLCLAPGAKREIAESQGALTGEGQIQAGVICSWVTIGLTVLAVVGAVLFLSLWSWSIGESVEWGS